MPNKNYLKGVRFERQVKKALEKDGMVCFRTAGSHSGADLIAIGKHGAATLIQCKVTKMVPAARPKFYPNLPVSQIMVYKTKMGIQWRICE